MNTVVKETHSPHPPGGAPGPFSLYDENILKESFIRSGFKDIALERMNVACELILPSPVKFLPMSYTQC